MRPTLGLFGVDVPSYAVFVLGAFVLALMVRRAEARRLGLAPTPARRWLGLAALGGAIVGSKLGMALFEPREMWGETFHRALGWDFSGKTVVGALLGGIAGVELAKKRLGIRERTGDQYAVALPLGIALGRVGCLFNGCCYGLPTAGPIAIEIAGVRRHPVQVYEAFLLLVLAALLYAARRTPRPAGNLWRLFLVGFFTIRFGVEFVRGDPSVRVGPLSLVQLACLIFGAAFGLSLLQSRPTPTPAGPR